METSELGAHNEEHAKCLLRILDFWQESRIQPERQCYLCIFVSSARYLAVKRTGRLVEIALEDMLVENEKRFENLEGMLVRC